MACAIGVCCWCTSHCTAAPSLINSRAGQPRARRKTWSVFCIHTNEMHFNSARGIAWLKRRADGKRDRRTVSTYVCCSVRSRSHPSLRYQAPCYLPFHGTLLGQPPYGANMHDVLRQRAARAHIPAAPRAVHIPACSSLCKRQTRCSQLYVADRKRGRRTSTEV